MYLTELAPAKVNLSLFVTGKRSDGYHTLSSFVTFTTFGDVINVKKSDKFSFRIEGPFASQLDPSADNLCVKAYHLMNISEPVEIILTKNMPVSSGIGGGSADAAATIRALIRLFDLVLPPDFNENLLSLGADVPVCFQGKPCHMGGIGEVLTSVSLPAFHMLLVNPGVGVSTPEIFRHRTGGFSESLMVLPNDYSQLRNDLELSASALFPVIKDVLALLNADPACKLARLSGSGATCFGVYENFVAASHAQSRVSKLHPEWWSVVTETEAS